MNSETKLLTNLFREDLLFVDMNSDSLEDVVKLIGKKMLEKGYVKESYVEAVLEREKKLPTGLELGKFGGVAIPHTDRQQVNESVIGVATFKEPISVYSMVAPSKRIHANLVFLLAIKDPDGQIEVLKELMNLFKKPNLLKKMVEASTQKQLEDVILNV